VTDSAADDLCTMASKSFAHYESSEHLLQQPYIEKAGQYLRAFLLPQDTSPALFLPLSTRTPFPKLRAPYRS
jgi:hypothetical protein